MSDHLTASDIAARLADSVAALVAELLPGGYRDGQEWRCGSTRGERGQSLAVRLTGAKRGVWCDFSEAGMGGDLLDLVKATKGLTTTEAMDWASDWLHLPRSEPILPTQRPERQKATTPAEKVARARELLRQSVLIWDTPAERYLLGRGLDMRAAGRLFDPWSLRFHGSVWHWPTEQRRPCMVAAVINLHSNELQGLHLTFLKPDGSGKADVEKTRLYYGPKAGGVVKLSPDVECTNGLAIGEGIETSAVGIVACLPSWAALDAGNLASLPVLPGIEALSVLEDHDPAGQQAAQRVAERWRNAGREVRVMRTAAPGNDWNDELRREVANG